MDNEFLNLLKQTINIYAFVSYNFHNDFTWSSSPISVPSRVQELNKIIRDKAGQEAVSTCQIYVDGSTTIDPRDRIILPDGTYPEILAIKPEIDEFGNIYAKIIYTR